VVYPRCERPLHDHSTAETLRITPDTKGSLRGVPEHHDAHVALNGSGPSYSRRPDEGDDPP
jgi:hypothetical protein